MTTQSTVYPDTKSSSRGSDHSDLSDLSIPEMKAQLAKMLEAGKARVSELGEGVQDGIRSKPLQSILIAAAVGAVVGLLVGRRSS